MSAILLLSKWNNILHGTNSKNTPHYCTNSQSHFVCENHVIALVLRPLVPSLKHSLSRSINI